MALFRRFKKTYAPAFPEGVEWLQGGPLELKHLKGKVTCLFFFSYANIACVRTFEFLRRLQKYKSLQIVGVHVPEFAFEHDMGHVRAALQRYGLTFPVLLDHAFEACAVFNNQWLPRILIIDADGSIVYDHIGEGGWAATESAVQQAFLRNGEEGLPEIPPDSPIGGGLCYRTTADLALGYVHGVFETQEEIVPFEEAVYTQTQKPSKEKVVGVHGHWRVEKEYLEHTRVLPLASEYLMFLYNAFSVNVVIEPLRHGLEVYIDLDGKPLPEDLAGEDVTYTKEGQSIIKLDLPRIYRVVDADTYHRGVLKMRVKDADMCFYAVMFGGCRNM